GGARGRRAARGHGGGRAGRGGGKTPPCVGISLIRRGVRHRMRWETPSHPGDAARPEATAGRDEGGERNHLLIRSWRVAMSVTLRRFGTLALAGLAALGAPVAEAQAQRPGGRIPMTVGAQSLAN